MSSVTQLGKIRKLNFSAAFLFAAVAVVFGIMVSDKYNPEVTAIPTDLYVVRRKLEIDPESGDGSVTFQARKQAEHVPWLLFGLVVAFMVLTSLGHLVVATVGRKTYEDDLLKRGYNRFRWVEYSITSAVMLVVLALSLGCQELWALVGLLVANVVMMYCGFVAECNLAPGRVSIRRALLAWGMGTFLFAFIWAYLGTGFRNALSDLEDIRKKFSEEDGDEDGQLPNSFFYTLFWGLGLLYFSFGFVQAVHIWKIGAVEKGRGPTLFEKVQYLEDTSRRAGTEPQKLLQNFLAQTCTELNKYFNVEAPKPIKNDTDAQTEIDRLWGIMNNDVKIYPELDDRAEKIRNGVEVGYISLSFVSKTLLSVLLIWGLSGRNQGTSKRIKDRAKLGRYPILREA